LLFVAVAKVPQVFAEGVRLRRARETIEAGRAGAGENTLAHAVLGRLCDGVRGETEKEDSGGRATIRRFVAFQASFNASLGIAAEHTGPVAGDRPQCCNEPVAVGRGDDQPRKTGSEGLGVGIEDLRGADVYRGGSREFDPPYDTRMRRSTVKGIL
jgi:hypothetical protein